MQHDNNPSNIYSGLSEETRVIALAAHSFSEALAGHAKVLEAVVQNTKSVKEYFSDAKGGFQDDLKNLKEANIALSEKSVEDILNTFAEENKRLLESSEKQYIAIIAKIVEENTKLINMMQATCNKNIIDKLDTVSATIVAKTEETGTKVFTKILILLLSSTGLLSLIVYLIEHFLYNKAAADIVKEVLNSLPK